MDLAELAELASRFGPVKYRTEKKKAFDALCPIDASHKFTAYEVGSKTTMFCSGHCPEPSLREALSNGVGSHGGNGNAADTTTDSVPAIRSDLTSWQLKVYERAMNQINQAGQPHLLAASSRESLIESLLSSLRADIDNRLSSLLPLPELTAAEIERKLQAIAGQAVQRFLDLHANLPTPTQNGLPAINTRAAAAVFKSAPTVPEFLKQADGMDGARAEGGLILRAGISLVASPRGVGKTLLALKLAIALANGEAFCGEILPASRVLYCAYENSPALLRDRLRRLGGTESENLRILTRSKAPKLQSDDWRTFPVEDYDFIIIDSLSPALEGGIDERQGGQNSDALAALLDIVQRGPGALFLANTTKTASSIRGSGVLSDRADLVFEVRDMTDFKPNPKDECWWDGLVENQGESAWAGRAKRRRGKVVFRLGLIASKTRVGPELEPRVLELALPADAPWTVTDVTGDVASSHARSKTEVIEKRQAREDAAIAALKKALPLSKSEAADLLKGNGISRSAARRIIDERMAADWMVTGTGIKGDPLTLMLINGENAMFAKPNADSDFKPPILADSGRQGRQESMFKNPSGREGSEISNSRRESQYKSRDLARGGPSAEGTPTENDGMDHIAEGDEWDPERWDEEKF